MPLIIILFIGILAFGLFDFMLGQPMPAAAVRYSSRDTLESSTERTHLPSLSIVAASEVGRCGSHDTACQLVALYRFVLTTVNQEESQSPRLYIQQHPTRTLFKKRGNAVDIAVLFSSLLDQRHIRNYVMILPGDSYVLACDISPSALRHAGGNWPAAPAFDPNQSIAADNTNRGTLTEHIDAYALNVGDAPCPCLLLDPSGPSGQQPGDPLRVIPASFYSAVDLTGERHALISLSRSDAPQRASDILGIRALDTDSPM